MEDRFVSLGNVFVYIFRDGRLVERFGELKHAEEDRSGRYIQRERTIVNLLSKTGDVIRYLNCSKNECEIFNNIVWLRESDIKKAADIFIGHEKSKIEELNAEIERREYLISLISSITEEK